MSTPAVLEVNVDELDITEITNNIIVGKDIPIECVDISTHSNMSKEMALIVGMINWELIRSGRCANEEFDKFSPDKEKGFFGKLVVSINQRSGIFLPDDYKKVFNDLPKNKWLTIEMRKMLSSLFLKMALIKELKLVKEK